MLPSKTAQSDHQYKKCDDEKLMINDKEVVICTGSTGTGKSSVIKLFCGNDITQQSNDGEFIMIFHQPGSNRYWIEVPNVYASSITNDLKIARDILWKVYTEQINKIKVIWCVSGDMCRKLQSFQTQARLIQLLGFSCNIWDSCLIVHKKGELHPKVDGVLAAAKECGLDITDDVKNRLFGFTALEFYDGDLSHDKTYQLLTSNCKNINASECQTQFKKFGYLKNKQIKQQLQAKLSKLQSLQLFPQFDIEQCIKCGVKGDSTFIYSPCNEYIKTTQQLKQAIEQVTKEKEKYILSNHELNEENQKEINKLLKENKQLLNYKTRFENMQNELNEKLNIYENTETKQNEKMEKLLSKYNEIKKEKNEYNIKIRQLNDELNGIKQSNNENIQEYTSRLEVLTQKNNVLMEKVNKFVKNEKLFNDKMNVLTNENEQLIEQKNEYKINNNELNEKVKIYGTKQTELMNQCNGLKNQNNELNEKLQIYETEKNNKMQELLNKYNNIKNENNKYNTKVKELNDELNNIKQSKNENIKEYNNKLAVLTMQNNALNEKIQTYEITQTEQNNTMEELTNKYNGLNSEKCKLKELNDKHNVKIKQMERLNNDLKDNNKLIKDKLNEQKKDNQQLLNKYNQILTNENNNCKGLNKKIEELEMKLKHLNNELDNVNKEKIELNEKLDKMIENNNSMKNKLELSKFKCSNNRTQVLKASSETKITQEIIFAQGKQTNAIEVLRRQLQLKTQENIKLTNEIDSLKQQLQQKTEDSAKYQQQMISFLQQNNTNLSEEYKQTKEDLKQTKDKLEMKEDEMSVLLVNGMRSEDSKAEDDMNPIDKSVDNPFDKIMEYFATEFPVEASVFSYYALVVFITSIGFGGDRECDVGDQITSWIAFILFILIPAVYETYKWYKDKEKNEICNVVMDICMKMTVLALLMMTVDLRPFNCYVNDEVALQLGILVVSVVVFILYFLLKKLHKGNQDE